MIECVYGCRTTQKPSVFVSAYSDIKVSTVPIVAKAVLHVGSTQ